MSCLINNKILTGWAQDKSSRKNVFQLNTSADFQILFQCDDKDLAAEWFEKIAEVVDSQVTNEAMISLITWCDCDTFFNTCLMAN